MRPIFCLIFCFLLAPFATLFPLNSFAQSVDPENSTTNLSNNSDIYGPALQTQPSKNLIAVGRLYPKQFKYNTFPKLPKNQNSKDKLYKSYATIGFGVSYIPSHSVGSVRNVGLNEKAVRDLYLQYGNSSISSKEGVAGSFILAYQFANPLKIEFESMMIQIKGGLKQYNKTNTFNGYSDVKFRSSISASFLNLTANFIIPQTGFILGGGAGFGIAAHKTRLISTGEVIGSTQNLQNAKSLSDNDYRPFSLANQFIGSIGYKSKSNVITSLRYHYVIIHTPYKKVNGLSLKAFNEQEKGLIYNGSPSFTMSMVELNLQFIF